MKSLPKISIYKYAVFSHTPTFGWYVSLLSIFTKREYRYYNESVNRNLFCLCYSMREGGEIDGDTIWRGKIISLELFFVKIFRFRIVDSVEVIPADYYE